MNDLRTMQEFNSLNNLVDNKTIVNVFQYFLTMLD
jgi:hypothetical protein